MVYIGVNCEWLPYIAGALTQLQLQSTWKYATTDELLDIQNRVNTLIASINCFTLPSLTDLQGLQGSGCEDGCMGCCERFNNGVLQQLVCGVWTDVPGQPPGGINQGSQPGGGSPQPSINGGCVTYHGQFNARNKWILPTVVTSGDTINIPDPTGAADDGGGTWYCPNGQLFFAGNCTGFTTVTGSDPMVTAPHMVIVAEIAGTFYNLTGAPFTVPGGITNAQVVLQVNDSTLNDNNGEYTFDVEVCNNQVGTFTHEFNFLTESGAPHVQVSPVIGSWVPGTGWVSGTSGGNEGLEFQVNQASTVFTHVKLEGVGTSTHDTSGSSGIDHNPGSGFVSDLIQAVVDGPQVYEVFGTFTAISWLFILTSCEACSGSTFVATKLTFEGIGADPFV